ncbi:MAG: fatty acid desaturase family protein [Bacteroidota bacterium]
MEQKKIRFNSPVNQEFIIELRQKVAAYFEERQLSKYGNGKLIPKALFMFALYLLPYFLMISGIISSFGGVLLCWILIGAGKAGVGMAVMHDANHSSFSANQQINHWLGKSMYLLGGFPANWRYQHNTMHHGFTNIEGYDEDIDPGPYLRISPHKPRLGIHRFQHLYAWFLYSLMTLSWVISKDLAQLNRYHRQGISLSSKLSYRQLVLSLIMAKAIYFTVFLVLPVLILPFAWYWCLFFFLMMHFTSGFILTTIFQTAHVMISSDYPLPDENGMMENNWAIHQLKTTSDFAPGNRLLSWFIGGLNYQIEHHLFPNISHVHYPAIAPIVRETASRYGLPYYVQPGFFSALKAHAAMLRKLGRE